MKIIIEGPPISKDRHRCGCTSNRKPFTYDPQVKNEMQMVKDQMAIAFHSIWESGNIDMVKEASQLSSAKSFDVTLTFLFPIKDSSTLVHRNAKLWGFENNNIKPDLDNLEKFYLDCATGLIWDDDSKVTLLRSKKYYDEKPRTEIEIMVKEDLKVNPSAEEVLLVFGPNKMRSFLKDIFEFMAWKPERIDELLPHKEYVYRENDLSDLARLVGEFAIKHANELKKIQKCYDINK